MMFVALSGVWEKIRPYRQFALPLFLVRIFCNSGSVLVHAPHTSRQLHVQPTFVGCLVFRAAVLECLVLLLGLG